MALPAHDARVQLYDLKAGGTYRIRVQGACGLDPSSVSDIATS